MAVEAGAWALGLVAEMPSGPGPISDEEIAEIVPSIPRGIESFLLSSRVSADGIIEHHRFCGTTTLQLVDHVPFGELRKIRQALPAVRIVQVIHVVDESPGRYGTWYLMRKPTASGLEPIPIIWGRQNYPENLNTMEGFSGFKKSP